METDTFLVTPANTLAYQGVSACVAGDEYFRRILLCGPQGSGKSTLVRRARKIAAEAGQNDICFEDPLVLPLPHGGYGDKRLIAALDDEASDAGAIRQRFQQLGGRIVSVAMETEIVHAVARETAAALSLVVDPEALATLVERLQTPARVIGALQRLQAEAALRGKREIDTLFALRVLGDYLYPG